MSRRIQHEKNNRYARAAKSALIDYEQSVRLDPGGPWQPIDSDVPHKRIQESKARRRLVEHDKAKLLRRLAEYLTHFEKQADRQRMALRKYAMDELLEILRALPRTRYLPHERRTVEQILDLFKIDFKTPWFRARAPNSSSNGRTASVRARSSTVPARRSPRR
jgi:hypothetical protein